MGNPASRSRAQRLEALSSQQFDVVVVGGGINGASSAAALSARGLSVALIDANDFASMTSQESSNLVWGGFKYLENYEIPFVFKLCRSRNRLMKAYPTVISEVSFLATLDKTSPFPNWLAALGTVGYWGLGLFATKRPGYYRPKTIKKLEPVINTETASGAIDYRDGYLKDNDARLVWTFVRSAIDAGAVALNYVRATDAHWDEANGGTWTLDLIDTPTATKHQIVANAIVNAAGPFVDSFNDQLDLQTKSRVVYSKGIHIVVPKLTDGDRVLAFFDETQRLFYVIPMANRSVIGTTDTRTDDPGEGVTPEDRAFLLAQINLRLDLESPLTEADIISERCGVRPLVVENDGDDREDIDWTSLSRKHEIEVDAKRRIVSIFGGKLTDCINIGEEVIDEFEGFDMAPGPASDDWYGEPPEEERQQFMRRAEVHGLHRTPRVEQATSMAELLWRRHGVAANAVLDTIDTDPLLAVEAFVDSDILRAELVVMAERELIVTAEDFFRRRTKLALIHRVEDLEADPGYDTALRLLGLRSTEGARPIAG
ncbi:MAG: FAD-dependent oxidoreductase [Acidimicrobiales bacterium]